MRRPASCLRDSGRRGVLAALLLFNFGATAARADNAIIPDTPEQLGLRGSADGALQLQVFVNGHDTRQVVAFARDAAGHFLAKRSDLQAVGLKTGIGRADATLSLEAIEGLTYRYNEDAQTLVVTVPEAQLAPKTYSAAPLNNAAGKATASWGAAINYDLFASSDSWQPGRSVNFGSGSLTFDARAFSPLGVVDQSAILGSTAFDSQTALRLDTTWRYDDEDRGIAYRAGDVVNAGLPWTRPIRLGGVQVEHGFGLRPDLVLGPSATVSGTAAVPSSADVFVNNFKIFSQPVDAGPFRIENLPAINGAGSATLVLRDVTGKETTQAVPFFVSSRLLAPRRDRLLARSGLRAPLLRRRILRLRPAPARQRLDPIRPDGLGDAGGPRGRRPRPHQRRRRCDTGGVRPRRCRRLARRQRLRRTLGRAGRLRRVGAALTARRSTSRRSARSPTTTTSPK